MNRPGKSASRPLLPIEPTIERRLKLNIEFKYWIAEFGINATMIYNCFKYIKKMAFKRLKEKHIRPLIFSIKEPMERIKIIKYVGEFY